MNHIHKINFFKSSSSKGLIFDISFTGLMLTLVMLFQYLEHFMPWLGGALKINLSLIFILITLIISGYPWAIFLLSFRFLVGTSFSQFSYTTIGMYSNFILLFSDCVFILMFVLFFYILRKIIKNQAFLIFSILLLSTIMTMLFLTTMNGIWISPIYWKLYSLEKYGSGIPVYPGIINYYHSHTNLHTFLFGIPNYWAGIWFVMGTGNLMKFSIVSILIFPIIKINRYLT